MDFEYAAQRLKRDQATMRPSSSRRNRAVSERARRQADAMKRRQQELMEEKRLRRRQEAHRDAYMNRCERSLGIRSLKMSNGGDASGGSGGLELRATSIHGDGDKIALPPSVLGFLTEQQMSSSSSSSPSSSPWIFRVGIRDPEYAYPASSLVRDLQPPRDGDDSPPMDDGDGDEDAPDADRRMDAYLDELNHKYLSYTHATVVEFTQEEGYVGLPELISRALLRPSSSRRQKIPATRTVDPASVSASTALQETDAKAPMDVDDGGDKTPGHLAWGAFDVPGMPIEVSLVRLPKGAACQLRPTRQAVASGFYNLKDVKLVLEQSLMRTRATLSTNDTVHTWHRGIRYDVQVTSVTPSLCDAIVCINTDIEVDFDAPEEEAATTQSQQPQPQQQQRDKHTSKDANNSNSGTGNADSSKASSGIFSSLGGGRTLASTSSSSSSTLAQQPQQQSASAAAATPAATTLPPAGELPPEPPGEQREHVCTVQLRGGNATAHGGGFGGNGRRRFDVTRATVGDLFAFAHHVLGGGGPPRPFSLVTRFPRRVLTTDMSKSTLQDAGISQGQELFMIERV